MKRIALIVGGVVAVLIVGLVVTVFILASRLDDKLAAPDTPYPDIKASTDPEVIARGEYLVRSAAHCGACHGDYERSDPKGNKRETPLSGGFKFEMGPIATLYSANITPDPETGIGSRTDGEIARTIRHGVLPNGQISIFMRYSTGTYSDEDLTAMVSYLRSLPPVKNPVPEAYVSTMGRAMFSLMDFSPRMDAPPKHVSPAEEPSVERGQYLAEHAALCVGCHTQYDMMTFLPNGPKAGGGNPEPSHGPDSDKEFVSPNLTSHATGVTGKLSEDGFLTRIRAGRQHTSSIMPWEDIGRMTDSDIRSIYRYLKTLPPVDNDVGPTYRDVGWEPGS